MSYLLWMPISRVFRAFATVCLGAVALSSTAQSRQLHQVSFTGAPAYTQAELLAFTGLKPGGSATQDQIQDAAQRLNDTGLFAEVTFSGNDSGIVYSLKPVAPNAMLPIRFSNFVWWQDSEIDRILKARVPLYRSDAVPTSGSLADSITAALKALLADKGLSGASVSSRLSTSRPNGPLDHIAFSIDSPPVVVRSLTLSGASSSMQPKLERVIREVKGEQWDESASYADISYRVSDVYRNDGYLDIALPTQDHSAPAVTTDNIGLDLTATLNEGAQYHVSQLAWPGSEFLSTADFNRQAKLKLGDPDSPLALRESLASIATAYGIKGYIDAHVLAPPVIDRTAHLVAYTISVVAGPQYRFKAVHWPGLSAEQAKAFDAAWQMKPGDVYDSEYLSHFVAKNNSIARQGLSINMVIKRDPVDNTVDLTVTFPSPSATGTK
jgi:outer membrane protein assembly factor BamA